MSPGELEADPEIAKQLQAVNAAERRANLARLESAEEARYARDGAELDRQRAELYKRREHALLGLRAAAESTRLACGAAIVATFYEKTQPLVQVWCETPSRTPLAELVYLAQESKAQCSVQLGEDLDLTRLVGVVVCRVSIAKNPTAVNTLALPSSWLSSPSGILEPAGALAASLLTGVIPAIEQDVRQLELAVARLAAGAVGAPSERAITRFELVAQHATGRDYRETIEAYDRAEVVAQDAANAAADAAERDAIRRFRAGDLSASNGKPSGWVETALKLGEHIFGPLHPSLGGIKRGVDPTAER